MTRQTTALRLLLILGAAALATPAFAAARGWDPAARVGVAFGPALLPTAETLKGLDLAIDLYGRPECYWVANALAAGATELDGAKAQADALRSALIERDVVPERVVAWAHVDPARQQSRSELQIYCSPPTALSLTFPDKSADPTDDTVLWLDVLAASLPTHDQPLTIRGYAAPREQADPLKLALTRALILRHKLIERGFTAALIKSNADIRAPSSSLGTNAEIVVQQPN